MVKNELAKKILVPIKTPLIREHEMDIFLVRDPKKSLGPVARELWDRMSCELIKSGSAGGAAVAKKGKK
jgi:hypothetical protein